ncbi:MAG: pseudaminic acid cytidylyltransferase, partial [Candidatus Latescibacteria bacterium]|nr:pseudaminic acid cytidylyltransferase [Candidatus Latescibacterota bacterium]
MTRLAIIPARGGSIRLPRKNILPLEKKPMICYPIEASLESNLFDQVLVSTDDEEIADIASDSGAHIIHRP